MRDAEVTEVEIGLARLKDSDRLAGFASRRVRVRLSPDVGAAAAQLSRALTEAISR